MGKEEIMFCKKCHKRVVEVVSKTNELKNRCRCRVLLEIAGGSELMGNLLTILSHEGRSGRKRNFVKGIKTAVN